MIYSAGQRRAIVKAYEDSEQDQTTSELNRLAALGSLFAGLGHQVSNLLLPLRLRLEAIRMRGVSPELEGDLRAMALCADHLQSMAKGFGLLAMDPRLQGTRSADLIEWWNEIEMLLRIALPNGVALGHQFSEGLPPARVAKHRLAQIVFGLVRSQSLNLRSGEVAVTAEPTQDGQIRMCVSGTGEGGSAEGPPHTLSLNGPIVNPELKAVQAIVRMAGGAIEVVVTREGGNSIAVTIPTAGPSDHWGPSEKQAPFMDAKVSVTNQQMSRYITALLKVFHADVLTEFATDSVRPALWVSDGSMTTPAELQAFLQGGVNRRILGVGELSEPLREEPRILLLGSNPGPGLLRESLRMLIQQAKTAKV